MYVASDIKIVIIAAIKIKPSLATWPLLITSREELSRLNRSKCFPALLFSIAITDVVILPADNLFLIPTSTYPPLIHWVLCPITTHFPVKLGGNKQAFDAFMANEAIIAETPQPWMSLFEPFVYLSLLRQEKWDTRGPSTARRGKDPSCRWS